MPDAGHSGWGPYDKAGADFKTSRVWLQCPMRETEARAVGERGRATRWRNALTCGRVRPASRKIRRRRGTTHLALAAPMLTTTLSLPLSRPRARRRALLSTFRAHVSP